MMRICFGVRGLPEFVNVARRFQMKTSTRYRLTGIFHEIKGTVRGVIGKISSNRILGAKGNFERITGKLQYRVGKVQGAMGL